MSGYKQLDWSDYDILSWDDYKVMTWGEEDDDLIGFNNAVGRNNGSTVIKTPGGTSTYTNRAFSSSLPTTSHKYKYKRYYEGETKD